MAAEFHLDAYIGIIRKMNLLVYENSISLQSPDRAALVMIGGLYLPARFVGKGLVFGMVLVALMIPTFR